MFPGGFSADYTDPDTQQQEAERRLERLKRMQSQLEAKLKPVPGQMSEHQSSDD